MTLRSVDSEKPQSLKLAEPAQTETEGTARLNRTHRLRVMYPRLEKLCKPQRENFWVLGGRPGAFKTALLWNLALNCARQSQRVLFVSLEMTVGEMAISAVTAFSGITRHRAEEALVEGSAYPFTPAEAEQWKAGEDSFCKLTFTMRMAGFEHGRNIEDILGSACRHNFDAVFIDHLGMIGRDSGTNELVVLSESIHRLRGLSRGESVAHYRPWVVATSQLNREIDKGDEDRPPRMSDFRGSARIEHDADVAIGLVKRNASKDEADSRCYLDGFVLKNRQGVSPVVLLWEANGATGLITERHRDPVPPPDAPDPSERWSDR